MTETAPVDSAFVSATAEICFHLHPSRTQMATAGVEEMLDEMVFKYNPKLGGVLLGYSDVLVRDKRAKILPGIFPLCRLLVPVKLHLFCPQPGCFLEGVVTLRGLDFVGLVVFNCFNASIRGAELCDVFSSPEKSDLPNPVFVHREDLDHRIEVGSRVRFMILGTREWKERSITIDGTLKAPNTGNCEWIEKRKEAGGGGVEGGAVGAEEGSAEGTDARWSCRNTEAEVQMNDEGRGGSGEERGRESEGVGVAGEVEGGGRDAEVGGGSVDAAQAQEEEQEGVKKKKKKKKRVSEGENGVVELGEEVVEGGEVNGAKKKRKSEGGEKRDKKEKKRKSL